MGRRLVRDRALENWVVPGAEHQVRPVESIEEHVQLLRSKLLEECGEVILAQSVDELLKEMADVVTVLEAMANSAGITWQEVIDMVNQRIGQSGGFVMGMVWETIR